MKWIRILVFGLWGLVHAAQAGSIASPNGQVVVSFELKEERGEAGCPTYSVTYKGKAIIADARMGLELDNGASLSRGFTVLSSSERKYSETWKPVCGERSSIEDAYSEMTVVLAQGNSSTPAMELVFRAYDAGAAFRYRILDAPQSDGMIHIERETTEFAFLADHAAWCTVRAQGKYWKTKISALGEDIERPLTLEAGPDLYIAIAEAALVDYARMKLHPSKEKPLTVVGVLSSAVEASLPLTTPWRVVMLADSPGQLLENNDIVLNLNEPCAIEDTSWIKPGRVIREVTLTTQGGKACVDFAVKHNLQYVMFDAGWYGNEYDNTSDATTVTVDPKRSPGPLDLHEVIRYGEERGIGIILYVNHRALVQQLDELLPLYKEWGVKGIKYGFVEVGPQQATSWLHEAVRKAAAHGLMVDIHDEYRPTGYSRTYPNLMTQEGLRGDEGYPSNGASLTLLFTRMLAGAGDNTICYYDSRVDRNATHAFQLAKAVCLYSPWQLLYWYDRPEASPQGIGGAGTEMPVIGGEPELEFFDQVPTVWDDTKVIHGKIGEYAVIARRSGEEWYVGAMNSQEARTLDVPLDFLEPGKKYIAHIYSDDETIQTRTKVRIDRMKVDAETILKVAMSAQGGQAIRIVPAGPADHYPTYGK